MFGERHAILTRRCAMARIVATAMMPGAACSGIRAGAQSISDRPSRKPLSIDDFRRAGDGVDWAPAFNRALEEVRSGRQDLAIATPSRMLPLLSAVEIIPDAEGWTPTIFANHSRFNLANLGAGFRYRGRKDSAPENPLAGGLRDCIIDYRNLGDPAINSGPRGVFISNGGGSLRFERVRGVNMFFGVHIQNWRYADGGRPGGGVTTADCDCKGARSDNRSHKWYPFADEGDLSVEMPGDVVPPGMTAVIATTEESPTSYNAKHPARALFWTNNTRIAIRIPADLSASSLARVGLTKGAETGTVHGQTLPAVIYAYWTSGGTRMPDCVVQAETGLIDGANHDGGYYGTMLSGTREYFVNRYRSRNNVRGIAGQEGAKNVHLKDIRISESLSSAILAGYNAPGWTIDDFVIEVSNARWIGEALINIQLGAPRARIGRGQILMGDDQKDGQYAVKIGPNSPDCRIEGPLTIKGDCARAYVAVESAWDRSMATRYKEAYPRADYRGLASIPMTGIALRNITIDAKSVKPTVATAIAIIQASDGGAPQGYHGEIPISNLTIENVKITSPKHTADLKFIQSDNSVVAKSQIRDVTLHNFETPAPLAGRNTKLIVPTGLKPFKCIRGVSSIAEYCR